MYGFNSISIRPSGQSNELVSHLNIDNSEISDIQTWVPKQRFDQVPAGSKHRLPIILHPPCLCIRGISQ